MNICLEDLLNLVKMYEPNKIDIVKKAYYCAEDLHHNQLRKSGEPYIIHPLNVAYILAGLHADVDTICAGLLHDTIEDTEITKEEIANKFNEDVANMVDGVSKLKRKDFLSKDDFDNANTRKIITSLTEDVRIIIIKLADRLHNMQTMQFMKEEKQKEKSLETLEIFAPLAYYIGAYRIKNELEDLSFKYLYPEDYQYLKRIKKVIEIENNEYLKEMFFKIKKILEDKNIPNDIKIRTKNLYGIYKRIKQKSTIHEMHDLLSLKIMVNDEENCYRTLYYIHQKYKSLNDKFKDYICSPKTNMYQSLHTTVFGPEAKMVQAQIRTFEMDKIASFGLAAYWDLKKGNARELMQQDLKSKYQFYKSLKEIDEMFSDNAEFVHQTKAELFSDLVYVYTKKGDLLSLPKGSTPIDFAYKIHTDIGNKMIYAIVNDEIVPFNYILKNKDRVNIVTFGLLSGPKEEWLNVAHTSRARKKIREHIKNNN